MEKLRIMSVFGTRPEAIKMAPLVKELAQRKGIESLCCVTAQHREMLDSVMQVFDLKADADLDIMTPRQTLSTITCKCLTGMDEVIDRFAPDMILVHGDTSTTFAGALSAFYHKVKIGHVEAGLRTYDKYSPYPEEMNRQLVTRLADLYFCPTENNRANLACESVTEGEIIDAIRRTPGARSLDGVKRRTRAGMGRCQAGFCSPRVMEILARELGVPQSEITKSGGASKIIVGTNKDSL